MFAHRDEMMLSMQQNNKRGLKCFSVGRVSKAVGFFQQALRESRLVLASMTPDYRSASTKSLEQAYDEATHLPNVIKHSDRSYFPGIYEEHDYVFRGGGDMGQAIIFFGMSLEIPPDQCALRCLFNLATCQYWRGLQNLENSSQYLDTARQLYELVYEMQINDDCTVVVPSLLLATLNNLGKIFRNVGHEAKSEKCFEHLLKGLVYFTSSQDIDDFTLVNAELKEDFLANTMHLILTDRDFAPAA
jgi:tetratricopeptide (TPR) repeat protein